MLEQLQEIYNAIAGREDLTLSPKDKIKDLGLSSLGLIQLICEIEDRFEVEITNQEILGFKTVKNVVDCMEKKLGK